MRIRVRAHAKVNLALRVGSRRDDGLHSVATVMQTVSLADRLVASRRDEAPEADGADAAAEGIGGAEVVPAVGAGDVPLELRVRWTSLSAGGAAVLGEPPEIPLEENTAWRAAVALAGHLRERGRRLVPLRLRLDKHVPPGAGLGGGSSDAAAALLACARLWCRPGEWPAGAVLEEIAAGVGADVPFFLIGGTAMATGSGRQVASLEPLQRTWLVLAAPPTPISTAAVYEAFDADLGDRGERESEGRPVTTAYEPTLDPRWSGNDLTAVARRRVPEIGAVLDALRELGAGVACMSGSGSACFGSFSDRRRACRVARRLRARGWWARAAVTVDREQHAAALEGVPG